MGYLTKFDRSFDRFRILLQQALKRRMTVEAEAEESMRSRRLIRQDISRLIMYSGTITEREVLYIVEGESLNGRQIRITSSIRGGVLVVREVSVNSSGG